MSRRGRWCPRCKARFSQETFSLLHDQAYLGDGRTRARVYAHEPCEAVVVVLLRYNHGDTS
jgi:hypothetical protein